MLSIETLRNDLYGEGYSLDDFYVSKMVGSSLKTKGTKIGHIKEVIKKYKNVSIDLEAIPLNESVELTMIYFALFLLKIDEAKEQFIFLDKKVEYANSWMITDFLGQYIHKISFKEYLPFFKKFIASKKEYKMRFAYVYMLKFYKEVKLDSFSMYLKDDERYYVYMSLAWLLATFAINDEEGIYSYLKENNLSLKTKRKTISKIVDSFRISASSKERFKNLRAL